MKFKRTPIAIAVAALLISPLALASENGDNGGRHHQHNGIDMHLSKSISVNKHVNITANGNIPIGSSAMAVINDTQNNGGNTTNNTRNVNEATVDGNHLRGANGNIGVNSASGANNMQDNAASIAASDAYFVFGSSDSEINVQQNSGGNVTNNSGNTNSAMVADYALYGASGNIGLNSAAGSGNMQKNNLAVTSSPSRLSEATIATQQNIGGNTVNNEGRLDHLVTTSHTEGTIRLTGQYTGYADQQGNVYPDVWANNSAPIVDGKHVVHPTNLGVLGHVDLDNQTQGGSTGAPAFDAYGQHVVANNDGAGALVFKEMGAMQLGGTVSSTTTTCSWLVTPNVNSAHLGGSSLMGASGNIGVNSAAGDNNLQSNSMAVAHSSAALGAPSGVPVGGE